jgi:hypothetical protein
MGRRALLIGSQTGGLTGVHGDVEVLHDALRSHDFDVKTIIERDATYDGIIGSYDDLIASTQPDDAVVVYYSGHGGRSPNRSGGEDPSTPTWLQYILPTDIDDRSGGAFRGILAEELSELQRRLTDRSQNVTTIFDCCHSSRMFRDPDLVPKADDSRGFPWDAVEARWKQVAQRATGRLGDVNPYAVQVVACEPDQSAYEFANSSIGGAHGALTAELVSVLRRSDALQLTWRELIEIVRPAILDIVPTQRADILGPQADRLLFSIDSKDTVGVVPVAETDGRLWIERAALFGVAEGDSFAVIAPGGDLSRPWAEVVVDQVAGDRARLAHSAAPPDSALPAGALAYPIEVSLGRRPIAIRPAGHPDRPMLVDALRNSASVRVADDSSRGLLAAVDLTEQGVSFVDAQGEPFWATARPANPATIKLLDESLVKLARATHVRDLGSGAGASELSDPADASLVVSYSRIDPQTRAEIPIRSGEHLHSGDLIAIRAFNGARENRYLSVLDVGLTGGISILTNAQPSGVTIASGETHIVGENAAHVLEGIELFWPQGLPAAAPRPESLILLISDAPVDGLPALEQAGVKTRAALGAARSASNPLERLIGDLVTNTRDARPVDQESGGTRYRVERFDFLLHPTPRPVGTDESEPEFEIDSRADATFRMILPRGAGHAPERVSVRLKELTVKSNRALLRSKVRIDFMVVTASTDTSISPYLAQTVFFDRIQDGDRLPFDNLLIYDGSVGRFLDIAVWVSKADDKEVALTELLLGEVKSEEVAGAITTLAALALAAPPAAAVAGSVAAVATLIRTGARLISNIAGTSIGVYRTTLLPHERFGAGDPVLRHPTDGMITAQDMALAYEVIDAT